MFNPKDMIKNLLGYLIDELSRFLIVLLMISIIVSIFISNFIVDLLPFILLAIIIFRIASKNKIQRGKENKIFLSIIKFFTKPFDVLIKNIKDEDHVYKRCSKCKTIAKLPLPNNRGKLHAKCPKCGKRLTIYTRKQIKVEIIKKK